MTKEKVSIITAMALISGLMPRRSMAKMNIGSVVTSTPAMK